MRNIPNDNKGNQTINKSNEKRKDVTDMVLRLNSGQIIRNLNKQFWNELNLAKTLVNR